MTKPISPQYGKAILISGLCAMAFAQEAISATCTLNTPGISFGSYDVFSDQPLDSAGNISINCDVATTYSITLGDGNGTYALRNMQSGPHVLNYNLYIDASRTTIWGDGTGSTAIITNTGVSGNHTVYGRVPARQNVYVGMYADSVTAVLNF